MGMYDRAQEESVARDGNWPADRAAAADPAWVDLTILPAQFQPAAPSPAHGQPEAALMRAVLEDAIQCLREGWLSTGRSKQRLAREALQWLFSDDLEWPFSFMNICTRLGLEPEYLRRGLRRWPQHPASQRPQRPRRVISARYGRRIAA